MPPSGDRCYKCRLCNKRTKPRKQDRRLINKDIKKYLLKCFMVDASIGEIICNTCYHKYYNQKHGKLSTSICTNNQELEPTPTPKPLPKSPPSVCLPIHSTSKSHNSCLICKRKGQKLIVVSSDTRFNVFLRKNILLPAGCRCCPNHIMNDEFNNDAYDLLKTTDDVFVNRTTLLDLINKLRVIALRNERIRINFDSETSLENSDFINLTGLNKEQFETVHSTVSSDLRNTPARTTKTSVGIFLVKLRSGMSNKLLSTIFNISKSSIRRAISAVRQSLMKNFVPENLGFDHISRENVIRNHTRPLAQSLFGSEIDQPAILVLDGTYIYIQKSENFRFQRRSYSVHKGRPLVKPMVVVTTSGYFLSILGSYFADAKNNDASILNHILTKNVENIKLWVAENDVFIVDRGFRDSIEMLESLGIKAEMPCFLKKGDKQMATEDANSSRLVTKVRWVVEAANSRIKQWKYLCNVLPTNQVPYIGDYVRIVCSFCNKFFPPLSSGNIDEDETLAAKMKHLSTQINTLQSYVEENHLDRRSAKWSKDEPLDDFPFLGEEEIRNLTCGSYQLKLSPSYMSEHLESDCEFLVHKEHPGLIRVKLQSRHVSSRKYFVWIQYTESSIKAWYCKCRAGARVVGVCSHIASIIWYLGYARHQDQLSFGVRDWGKHLDDAYIVDESDTDESVVEE